MTAKVVSTMLLVAFLLSGAAVADEKTQASGYLGVLLAPVPEALRAHGVDKEGAMIQDVLPGSPAEELGLKLYDIIIAINGEAVKNPGDVSRRIRSSAAGDTVSMTVRRGAKTLTLETSLARAPRSRERGEEEASRERRPGFLGVQFSDPPLALLEHLNLKKGSAVVLEDVYEGSPAAKAGLERMDVILAIDGEKMQSADASNSLVARKLAGAEVEIEYLHRGEKNTVKVRLSERPAELGINLWAPRSNLRGRIILRLPDGKEQFLQIPDLFFKAHEDYEEILETLGEQFELFRDSELPQLKRRIRLGLRELEKRMGESDVDGWTSSRSHSAVVRTVEGGYDITYRDENGIRTVTVLKDGETIAERLPYDEINTLPEEVRSKVKKMVKKLKIDNRDEHPPKIKILEGKRVKI